MVKGKPLVRQGGRTLQGKIGNEDVDGLGTAATRDVGPSDGQVPEFVSNGDGLGGFGYGRAGTSIGKYADVNDVPKRTGFYLLTDGHPNSTNNKAPAAGFYDTCIMRTMRQGTNEFVDVYLPHPSYSPGMVIAPHDPSGYVAQRIVSDSLNLRDSTGNSTIYPMSQKAVTDALAGSAYSAMSVSEGDAGTSETLRTMRSDYLRQIISKIPSNPKTSQYTAVANDRGRSIDTTSNVIIPAGVFSVGDVLCVTNTGESDISIFGDSGVTLRKAGTTATGTMTLGGYGVATLRLVQTNVWFVTGSGLV